MMTVCGGRSTAAGSSAHAKTAGYLNQAHLRHELSQRLGAEWSPVGNGVGVGELTTVTESLRRLFSKRRAAIVAELAREGRRSARAAQVATLATRPAKIVGECDDDLRVRWSAEALAAGFPTAHLTGSLTKKPTKEPTSRVGPSVGSLAVTLSTPTSGLTAKRSTFSRLDMLQGVCDRLSVGAAVPRIEDLADQLLADARFVTLGPSQRRGVPGQSYTTRELLDIEHDVSRTRAQKRRAPTPSPSMTPTCEECSEVCRASPTSKRGVRVQKSRSRR